LKLIVKGLLTAIARHGSAQSPSSVDNIVNKLGLEAPST
jgi:hypothetical protein